MLYAPEAPSSRSSRIVLASPKPTIHASKLMQTRRNASFGTNRSPVARCLRENQRKQNDIRPELEHARVRVAQQKTADEDAGNEADDDRQRSPSRHLQTLAIQHDHPRVDRQFH